jgi:uncharacterized coiled-coil protein SlyX
VNLRETLIWFMGKSRASDKRVLVYLESLERRSIEMAETIDTLNAKVDALIAAETALAANAAAHKTTAVATQAQLDALGAKLDPAIANAQAAVAATA